MFFECISCPKLGISCDGPNFLSMSVPSIMEWCKQRKAFLKWSNAKIAEEAQTPKGTVDRLFSSEVADCKVETLRPIVQALIGGSFTGNACPDPAAEPDTALVLRVHDLEKDLSYADKTINLLENGLKSWRRAIFAMTALCSVMAFSLIGYIQLDMNNTDIGLIRDGYTSPAVLFPILGVLAVAVVTAQTVYKLIKHRNKRLKK